MTVKKGPLEDLLLPAGMRADLQRPLGALIQEAALVSSVGGRAIFVVGDIATLTVVRHGMTPRVCIIDFKTKRTPRPDLTAQLRAVGEVVLTAKNPPGGITPELVDCIVKAMGEQRPVRIEVDGEEDLAALHTILHAPDGSVVIYGMPDKGLVLVSVDAGSRERVRTLIGRFERRPRAL